MFSTLKMLQVKDPRVEIYYLYKLNVFFFLPGILKVLIDKVSTEEKLTIEQLSAVAVKAMNYNHSILFSIPST